MNFESIIDDAINNKKALRGSFSGPINKDRSKVKIKTIVMKGEAIYKLKSSLTRRLFTRTLPWARRRRSY